MNPKQQSSFAPWEAIFARDGNFYGSTLEGGPAEGGLIYKLTPAGRVRSIAAFPRISSSPSARNFGENPEGRLAEGPDGSLYGSTRDGGVFGNGVIYQVQRDGRLSVLYHYESSSSGSYKGPLICSEDGTLYALTANGQTLVRLSRDGTRRSFDLAFSTTFGGGADLIIAVTGEVLFSTGNKGIWKLTAGDNFEYFGGEGFHPRQLKLLPDGSIVGIATQSSDPDLVQRIFRVDAEGSFSVLHEFGPRFEGLNPFSLIVQSDGSLIGATNTGGLQNAGTIFKLLPETGEFSILRHLPPHFFTKLGAVWMKEAFSYAAPPPGGNLKPAAKDDIIPAERLKTDAEAESGAHPQVKINVLANDTDTNGDSLTIVSIGTARHGVATLDEVTGKIIYTADGVQAQNDSFTYTISDGKGATATASVIIRTRVGGRYEGVVMSLKDEASGDPGTVIGSLELHVTDQRVVKGILTVHGISYSFTGVFNQRNLLGKMMKESPIGFLKSCGLQLHLRENGGEWNIEATIRSSSSFSTAVCELVQ